MASETPNSFSSRRRWFVGLNSLLAIGAFLAIMVMVNYLASGHFTRSQWGARSAFRLSPQTTSLLHSVTNNIEVTLFFSPHGDEEDMYSLCVGLLSEYQNANPKHIHIKTLDYERFPSDAKAFLTAHNLNSLKDRDIVVFESNGHTKIHYAKNLAEYDFSAVLSGQSKTVRRSAFRGEMFFTSAILAVTYPRQLKTYFLAGHGEHSPGSPTNEEESKSSSVTYSKFAGILKDEADSDWARLSLLGTNTIPADCQLLVVAGPHRGKLLPEELSKIAEYLKQGGRLLALLNNECGLEDVLEPWGVKLGDSPLIEHDSRFRIGLSDKDFWTARFGTHPTMKPLLTEQLPIRIASPRAVFPIANNSKIPGAPEISVLAETSDIATDGRSARKFPLMVAVEQGIKGVNTTRGGSTRMIVVGDADFLDDAMIDSVANHYFASLAVNWLLERPEILLEGISAQPIREYKLILSGSRMFALQWLFLAGLPGCIIAFGTLVWLRRRR
jgi:ABC-type uncharacterized transport system involved in gliding motility auxiliary subunit